VWPTTQSAHHGTNKTDNTVQKNIVQSWHGEDSKAASTIIKINMKHVHRRVPSAQITWNTLAQDRTAANKHQICPFAVRISNPLSCRSQGIHWQWQIAAAATAAGGTKKASTKVSINDVIAKPLSAVEQMTMQMFVLVTCGDDTSQYCQKASMVWPLSSPSGTQRAKLRTSSSSESNSSLKDGPSDRRACTVWFIYL
jgi:hypothetical protein